MVQVATSYCVFKLMTISQRCDTRFRFNPHALLAVDGGWFDDREGALDFVNKHLQDEELCDRQYVILPVIHVGEEPMLNDKLRADWDQGSASMVELYPSLWKSLYVRCKEEGFDEKQSMELVKTFIIGQVRTS